jgi:hypothetical protein
VNDYDDDDNSDFQIRFINVHTLPTKGVFKENPIIFDGHLIAI